MIVGILAACSSPPPLPPESPANAPPPATPPAASAAPPGAGSSRWVPVDWSELPGFADDDLFEAWNAWIKSCARPGPAFAALCGDVRRLSIAEPAEQRAWMVARLRPYRIEAADGRADGLLTAYYEPVIPAARRPGTGYSVPLYAAPAGLGTRRPWYTRQQIETLPEAQAALRGREIAWLADPVEAMVLHIQGSGRLRIAEPDGSVRLVRLAYAGTNDQPYGSIGRWLLDQGLVRDATWPGIRAWLAANPQRVNELMWSNPRYVFFREEPLSPADAAWGPRGAQGVELTPGRSIAVDRNSIPYGTPVWLASSGPQVSLQRLVLAQDTGSAIVGAVRADYFAGWGPDAGEIAGRLKQPLRLWALWPK
ncbi:murein transglycosylase A [Xylophilus sp.]|uniref:murein transglycosylase A n=1 Tax=Xylophilus sp. TaxID=2653893 RepID=UPI0013BD43F5|nr:MltA domain-containing protein [Xylophilus sp.]KAF1048207.1 MAG: Membrane-bound lytic murein transglycosylase A [Xylophilus sp.]